MEREGKSHKRLLDQLFEKDVALDLIMENLKAEKLCTNVSYSQRHKPDCYCHGTGTIVRDATPEEVREGLEWLLVGYKERSQILSVGFRLKSGAVLFMEEK